MRSAVLLLVASFLLPAQRPFSGAPEIKQAIDKLNVVGSALMIAAHPDDENTAIIAYLARGKKVRTAYLSLNRGEGGQNLIGSEQGVDIGIIRTQELMAARRIDGGEQFFTRAIDFGFSKNADETFGKWGREEVLRDVVWTIRRFKPDIIVNRFSGTPNDGHGHHQASALLAKEAFVAAADAKRFPEQLKWVETWQAKRMVWNVFAFTPQQEEAAAKQPLKVAIDTGEYDPLLGYSFSEIAGISRSAHKSQAMGSPERKGAQQNYFIHVAGEIAMKDAWDGIETTWKRVPGAERVGELLAKAAAEFTIDKPGRVLPHLLEARKLLARRTDHYSVLKRQELDEAIALTAGVWIELQSDRQTAVQGGVAKAKLASVQRGGATVQIAAVDFGTVAGVEAIALPIELPANRQINTVVTWKLPSDAPLTQPYFLTEPRTDALFTVSDMNLLGLPESPAPLIARVGLVVDGTGIELRRGMVNRYVDRSAGELVRPFVIVPPVSVRLAQDALIFADAQPRKVEAVLKANQAQVAGSLRLDLPAGWKVEPASLDFNFPTADEEKGLSFTVTPPVAEGTGKLRAVATVGGKEINHGTRVIAYPHIPPQTLAPVAEARLVRANVKNLSTKVGYVMGAGDEVPDALRQLGCDVTLLSPEDLAVGNLRQYDAIVTGVRAYNTRPDLRANAQRIFDDYVAKGGSYIVQYNVLEGGFMGGDPTLLAKVGPYPISTSRERVTDENAPISFPNQDHRLLQFPNRIVASDFEGWVQERGLYFASKWDERYVSLFSSFDPGEKPMLGGTLVTKYGQGNYIFTPMSWFRQLPAGVPGAFRIFANFLSAGKN